MLHLFRRIVFDGLTGFRIDALGPVQILDVLRGTDERAVGTVERVEEAIAAKMTQHFPRLAVDRDVVDHLRADLVIVVHVVRRVLEIPDDLAGVGVDGEGRVGVEIVARPVFGIEHRRRLTGTPIQEVGRRVISSDIPEGATAGLPSVMVVSPGLVAGFARRRDRVSAPQHVAGLGVDRHQPTASADIGAGSGDDDHVLDDQRRTREEVGVGDLEVLVPQDLAGILVDRDAPAIGGEHGDLIVVQRDPAVGRQPHGRLVDPMRPFLPSRTSIL